MPRRPPTARTRGLGAELRELRTKTGLSTRAVAERLDWSHSTLNRIENGRRKISSEDVAALLVIYEVAGEERDRLLALARDADKPGWWETGHTALPGQLTALIGFESQATAISDVALTLIPGYLQTPEYTRGLLLTLGMSEAETETRVATRLGRQAVLSRPTPPEYLAILDESALRRPIGGPAVMAEQIRHVIRVGERARITIQVIPCDRGAHPGLTGSFLVLEFARQGTIVHLEQLRSSIFVDDPGDVQPFVSTVDTLRETALDPVESVRFLAAVAAEYEK